MLSSRNQILRLAAITLLGLLAASPGRTAEISAIQATEIVRCPERQEIRIPEAAGFKVLKCDFHMHTVFSDGIVWPTVRVEEAWREGLDAIAITDHIEGEPRKQFIGGDHNASYEIASPAAKDRDILLVRGGEITRDIEGHYNALFLKDANAVDTPEFLKAIEAAIAQGAYIFWNHPLAYPRPGQPDWSDVQENLVGRGWLHGIEVFNEREWYPIALDWCVSKNLSVMGNSDIHEVTSEYYDLANRHRPMTLVLAKERTLDSLREALFAHRTVAWFGDSLAGNREILDSLVQACVTLNVTPSSDGKGFRIEFRNLSDIPFAVDSKDLNCPGHLWLGPRASQSVVLPVAPSGEMALTNVHTGSGEVLITRLHSDAK